MKYGAAATLINSNQSPQHFNSEHSAYYNYESQDTDHDIAIVGWDDDFSVNNFGLDDGWDGTATSASLIASDESKDVTFDSQGIAWARFEPATSGFYDVSCMASQGSPQSYITETVYKRPEGCHARSRCKRPQVAFVHADREWLLHARSRFVGRVFRGDAVLRDNRWRAAAADVDRRGQHRVPQSRADVLPAL